MRHFTKERVQMTKRNAQQYYSQRCRLRSQWNTTTYSSETAKIRATYNAKVGEERLKKKKDWKKSFLIPVPSSTSLASIRGTGKQAKMYESPGKFKEIDVAGAEIGGKKRRGWGCGEPLGVWADLASKDFEFLSERVKTWKSFEQRTGVTQRLKLSFQTLLLSLSVSFVPHSVNL